jgi:urea transport system substrate-binding protein
LYTTVETSGSQDGSHDAIPREVPDTDAILEAVLTPAVLGEELGWLAHYKVVRVLGRGAMGLVLEAEDSQLRRPVALKIMLPSVAANAQARERFLREARAVAALRNEHVVVIYQVGQERDIPYLAMELLRGQSLEERLRTGPRLPLAEVARIGRELADGLAAAHEAGLIHRDIKPANVWLEENGRVKILDFGLVRPARDNLNLTGSGLIVGTPYFMSPEQARGQAVDARTDLFSLGVVLYSLATGKLPFAGDSLMAILTSLAVDTPQPLRSRNPQVSAPLEELVGRLLEKDPDRRPSSAREVASALRQIELQTPSAQDAMPPSTVHNLPAPLPTQVSLTSAPAAPIPAKRRWPRRARLAAAALLAAVGLAFLAMAALPEKQQAALSGPPVLIGVLHSRTGTMAISERPVINAVLLAVEEVNKEGGVLGRPVEAVIADGQSDERVFARQAEKLIDVDQVCTILGCWTSASRKAVKPVVESRRHLLIYPVQYEGMEQSPNIIYGGAVPNQQILPALKWSVGFLNRKRWFLVGSDYVFPHAAHEVIKDEAAALGCQIVGEEYLPLGSADAGIVARIGKLQPDLILNTLNGDSNVAFFRCLRKAGVTPERIPTLSFSISEVEVSSLTGKDLAGDYVASSYFEDLDLPQNHAFLRAFRARYGEQGAVSDPVQTAYYSVHLWAQAARAAGSTDPAAVREALKGRRLQAPQGPVQIDPANQHTAQHARIGCFRLTADGSARLEEVYVSPRPISPEPFPASRPRQAWQAFLDQLQQKWHGNWANPGS